MAGAVELWDRRLPVIAAPARWVRLRPPGLALALVALGLAGQLLLSRLGLPMLPRAPLAGAALAAAGLAWMLWAAWHLRRAATTLLPIGLPTVLVEEGPYRFGRNPMYLGMAVVMAGIALAAGAPLVATATMVFVRLLQRLHIPFEEARLKQTFGAWYSDYAAQVRRWL